MKNYILNSNNNYLCLLQIISLGTAFVQGLAICLVCIQPVCALAEDGHDHDHDAKPTIIKPGAGDSKTDRGTGAGRGQAQPPRASGSCNVPGNDLVDFANGQRYFFPSLVTFLTAPECREVAHPMSRSLLSQVTFKDKGPYRLDTLAKLISKEDLGSAQRVEDLLANRLPQLLQLNPLTIQEMMPVVGQLSLLSGPAAKTSLAWLIEQELVTTDLSDRSNRNREAVIKNLADRIGVMGATEPSIASELARVVEERAMLAQADSLGKFFQAMAEIAAVDSRFSQTFNLSASRLNEGIRKNNPMYTDATRRDLTRALFSSIESAAGKSISMEPGLEEFNLAMQHLLQGRPLDLTALKVLWKNVLKVLTVSVSQRELASAFSMSLTPKVVYLSALERIQLFEAARNYPEIAKALQENFLLAWTELWEKVNQKELSLSQFNEVRNRYLEPVVEGIFDLEPQAIDPFWLREVLKRGLVSDMLVERKLPRLVAHLVSSRAGRKVASQGIEPVVRSLAEDISVVWTLSQIHLPELFKWISKYESKERE